jgi:hypothetical protein
LHASVELMPAYRAAGDSATGALLYEAAAALYRERLPLTEHDIARLLLSARHGCGHGCDTRAPFDLAMAHMRRAGYSPRLADAIEEFRTNLPPAVAITVKELHRSADLISVLLGAPPLNGRVKLRPWIEVVAEQLSRLEPAELEQWRRLVLAMSVSERHVMPKTWQRAAQPVLDTLGGELVVTRLKQWWPEPGIEISLKKSGAQLLKHFIWTLGLVSDHRGDQLVCNLATNTWHPSAAPMAVLKPAAAYLAGCTTPPAVQARRRIEEQIAAAS